MEKKNPQNRQRKIIIPTNMLFIESNVGNVITHNVGLIFFVRVSFY